MFEERLHWRLNGRWWGELHVCLKSHRVCYSSADIAFLALQPEEEPAAASTEEEVEEVSADDDAAPDASKEEHDEL